MNKEEIKKNRKLLEYLASKIAKDDIVVKEVWDHYYVHKRKEPLEPWRVKHFWMKLGELTNNTKWLERQI